MPRTLTSLSTCERSTGPFASVLCLSSPRSAQLMPAASPKTRCSTCSRGILVRDVDVGVHAPLSWTRPTENHAKNHAKNTRFPYSPLPSDEAWEVARGPRGDERGLQITNLKCQLKFRWPRNNTQTEGQMGGVLRASRGVVAGSFPISYRSLSSPAAKSILVHLIAIYYQVSAFHEHGRSFVVCSASLSISPLRV